MKGFSPLGNASRTAYAIGHFLSSTLQARSLFIVWFQFGIVWTYLSYAEDSVGQNFKCCS
jgi:hypothetical protein